MLTRPLLQSLFQFLLIALLALPAQAIEPPERLVYDANWNGIGAGTAIMELTRAGDALRSVNTIRSSGFVSAFFRIDDRIESVMSRDGRPILYRASINEGKHRSLREVTFDFKRLQAETRDLNGKSRWSAAISTLTHDNLSSLYFIRSAPLSPGKIIRFEIYDGKRLWNVETRVVKRQPLSTTRGTVRTLMVTSTLKANGTASPVGGTTFWFTDDARHIPLKIKTKIKVGEMTLTLRQAADSPSKH